MPVRPSLPSLSAAEGFTGAAGWAVAVFTAVAAVGSTVEAEVEVFMAVGEASAAADTGRPRLVTEPLMVVHRCRRCVQGADTAETDSGLGTVIPAIPDPAVVVQVETSGSEAPRRLRQLPPMDGGIRFPAKAGIADRQVRHHKRDRPQAPVDSAFMAAAAGPHRPVLAGVSRVKAIKFGKTRPPLGT